MAGASVSLQLDDVTVTYGEHRAVDGLSLAVGAGEILGLVGPSGCGKSTLLRAIAGLVEPASGTIAWEGVDLTTTPTEQRDIGFMFQDHALFTHRSVAENIGFGLRMRGVGNAQRADRVGDLLDVVGLAGFGDRSVEQLSGGEAQRVALARALAPEPRLLLLDEPLASLDRARRDELNEELSQVLRRLGQTAIYVTHDQHEAFAVADRIGVMHQGRLVRIDTPAAVWRDPRTEFVARFVGHDTIIEHCGERVAVPAAAVVVAESGADAHPATVIASRFQGDRHLVTIEVDGATWRLWHDEALAAGTALAVRLIDSKVARLDRAPSA